VKRRPALEFTDTGRALDVLPRNFSWSCTGDVFHRAAKETAHDWKCSSPTRDELLHIHACHLKLELLKKRGRNDKYYYADSVCSRVLYYILTAYRVCYLVCGSFLGVLQRTLLVLQLRRLRPIIFAASQSS
jgi:hypothetical protein